MAVTVTSQLRGHWSSAASLCLSVLALLAGGVWLAGSHPLSVLAVIICLVTAIPLLLQRRWDMFAPWNFMFYFVVLNVLLRSVFIDYGVTGGITDLDIVFYLGKPHEFLLRATGVLLLGFTFLTLGYLWLPNGAVRLEYGIFRTDGYSPRRFKLVVTVMLTLALASLAAFIYLTFTSVTEFAISMLSQHRGISSDLSEYHAYGYLRLLIGFANIVIYLVYIRLRMSRESRGFYRAALVLAMTIALAMAFYSQSRSSLVFVFLNLIFVKYYLDGRRFSWKGFAIAAPIVIALFLITSSLRGGSGVDLNSNFTPMTVVAPIILNNGGMDASKTGHIIDFIDETQEFEFGKTLIQFLIAVVPRQIWPEKPTNLDTYIGEKIYGAETYGTSAVPPGFFAEMYMNYWYAGIMVGAFALGILMKAIQNILAGNRRNTNFVVFYVIVLQSFGLSVLGSGFSSAMMGSLMSGVPLVLALYFVTPRLARNVARDAGVQPYLPGNNVVPRSA